MIATEYEYFTSADLLALPQNGKRYEIIEGDLVMSRQPGYEHQFCCGQVFRFLQAWSEQNGSGATLIAPGVIFADDDDVAPDVIWISRARLAQAADKAGHLHTAPELAVEVLSPGSENARRDRETKRKLYARRGVAEYWILDWMQRRAEVYRREHNALTLVCTLFADETLTSPLFPGFTCRVGDLFFPADWLKS
jgi:Uma2 family endonuclease